MTEEKNVLTRQRTLLSLQRALLGEVFPTLRGVALNVSQNGMLIIVFIDGTMSSSDCDSINEIEGQVLADFPESISIESKVVQCDLPTPLPQNADWLGTTEK